MDLDELLNASAPPISVRTPELIGELNSVVTASEAATEPPRRRIGLIVAGSVAAGVVGLGTAAYATGVLPDAHWPWSTSTGSSCELSYSVVLNGVGGNLERPAPGLSRMSLADRQVVLAAARQFLASFDYASINRQEAIARWQAGEAKANAEEPADERQPELAGDELEITAVQAEIGRQLDAYLVVRGLNPNAIIPGAGDRCTK